MLTMMLGNFFSNPGAHLLSSLCISRHEGRNPRAKGICDGACWRRFPELMNERRIDWRLHDPNMEPLRELHDSRTEISINYESNFVTLGHRTLLSEAIHLTLPAALHRVLICREHEVSELFCQFPYYSVCVSGVLRVNAFHSIKAGGILRIRLPLHHPPPRPHLRPRPPRPRRALQEDVIINIAIARLCFLNIVLPANTSVVRAEQPLPSLRHSTVPSCTCQRIARVLQT